MGSAPGKIRTMATAPPTTVTTVTTATARTTSTATRGSGSSPETQEADDFVMVPAHLTMDAAENRKKGSTGSSGLVTGNVAAPAAALGRQGAARRHTVSGDPHRPSNLPMQIGPSTEPIPVPTQKGKIFDYWALEANHS